jgi:hypothetical protein
LRLVGVSRTLEGNIYGDVRIQTRGCTTNGQPGPLTIAGGVARYNGSALTRVTWEGPVNAQGVLVLHSPYGERFDGQIDGHGTVTGRSTGNCAYQMVWQKEGK